MAQNKFGVTQLVTETPTWAKWMFRIVFILTTIATFIIAADPAINDALKVRIGVYLKGFDMAVWAFSKMFGVSLEDATSTFQKPAAPKDESL